MILKKYKNNLLTIIQESGLDPNLFTAENETIDKREFFKISLRDSPLHFLVRPYGGSFNQFFLSQSMFCAGFATSDEYHALEFKSLAAYFKHWLDDVVKNYLDEVFSPDLWQILEEKTGSHTKYEAGATEDFDSFSDEDKIGIRLSLKEFRLLIVKNFNPNQEELKVVDARLNYLSDAMDKHNKFDWKGIAINTAIAITVALSLGPEQGRQLLDLFKQVFSNVLYLLP